MNAGDQKKNAGATKLPHSDSSDTIELHPEKGQRKSGTREFFPPWIQGNCHSAGGCLPVHPPLCSSSRQTEIVRHHKNARRGKGPDFVLTDLKGQKFRLSDHRGKRPVLIIFSTTWCTFCKAEIPHFKSLYATYAQQGLEVVNIDIQEPKEKVAKFASQNQLPYRVLLDEDGSVSGVYEIRGVPTMVLVDKKGMVACRQCRTVESVLASMMKK